MSSSEFAAESQAARRYLAAFAAAAAAVLTLLLALCWATDPTGLLRAEGLSPGLCGPGIANWDERHVKPLIAASRRPEEILLGSSRVGRGFGAEAFGDRRVANLALSSASLSEIDRLARFAVDQGGVRRVWIGLDFLAFSGPEPAETRLTLPDRSLSGRSFALRYGLLDWRAMGAAIRAAVFFRACRTPRMDAMGFALVDRRPPTPVQVNPAAMAALRQSWSQPAPGRAAAVAERLARLDRLLGELKARDIETVLFLSPAPSPQRAAVAGTAYVPLYRDWRAAIVRIAGRRGARLIRSDDPAFLRAIPAPLCPGAAPEDCLFDDIRHFRPIVGAAIVRAAEARP